MKTSSSSFCSCSQRSLRNQGMMSTRTAITTRTKTKATKMCNMIPIALVSFILVMISWNTQIIFSVDAFVGKTTTTTTTQTTIPFSPTTFSFPQQHQQHNDHRSVPKSGTIASSGVTLHMHNEGGGSKKKVNTGFGGTTAKKQPKTFAYSGSVVPGKISPQRKVITSGSSEIATATTTIIKPDYSETGIPIKGGSKMLFPWMIEVKTPEEIVKMKLAGKLARHVLDVAGRAVQPGRTTDEIDTVVHNEIIKVRKTN